MGRDGYWCGAKRSHIQKHRSRIVSDEEHIGVVGAGSEGGWCDWLGMDESQHAQRRSSIVTDRCK